MKLSDEEKMIAARASDLAASAETGTVCYSDFLSPAERSRIMCMKELLNLCKISFDGGYPDAERVRARFSPADFDYEAENPIAVIEISCRTGELIHRDILGAVLGLGIARGKIGDILVDGNRASVMCDKDISPYIINNLTKTGRTSVKVSEGCISNIPQCKKTKISAFVTSLRLDSVAAEGFSISRTQASEMIKSGLCFVNWIKLESPAHILKKGDTVTLRGKGRLEIHDIGGQSRKGRTFIELLK